ncbi:right-handed parallel beta-helix repeat-containing protein [Sphingomonas sp. 22L2VL55-3]
MAYRRRSILKLIISTFAVLSVKVRAAGRVHINVKSFGAIGDGKFDNTNAINLAFEEAKISGPVAIYFPRGRYLFTNIEVEFDDVEVFGVGAVLISSLPVDTQLPAIWLRGRRIWVHDLAICYQIPVDVMASGMVAKRGPNAYGLRLGGGRKPKPWYCEKVLVENVEIKYARGGGMQISNANNVMVRKSVIYQVLGNGLGFDNCQRNVTAKLNNIQYAGDDLLVIVTDDMVPGGTKNVNFILNVVGFGFAKGIATSGSDGILIASNQIFNTYASGIVIFSDRFYNLGSSKNVVVKENTVRHAGHMFGKGLFRPIKSSVGDSVFISSGSSNVKIIGNNLYDSIRDGIVATFAKDLLIVDNRIGYHPGTGILLGDIASRETTDVERFEVSGNIISDTSNGISVGSSSFGIIYNNTINLSSGRKDDGVRVGSINNVTIKR